MKSIIRIKKDTNFIVMDKSFLNDTKLSWKAKGIMAYMLSKPDDWTFYLSELIKHATDGEASFRTGFNELREQGYVKRYPIRKGNRIKRWETIVLENPLLGEFQEVENQDVEKQDVENQALPINDCTKNDCTKNKEVPYVEIINFLNEKTGKKFRTTTRKTKDLIKARWNEGFRLEDYKKVIEIKNTEWKNDKNMKKYLRPETLFGPKFEGYLNQDTKGPSSPYDGLF